MTTEYRFGPGEDREFVAELARNLRDGRFTVTHALELYDAREAARPCPHYEPAGTGGAGASRVKGCCK